MADLPNGLAAGARVLGDSFGRLFESAYPAVRIEDDGPFIAIPADKLDELTEAFLILIAEAIQSWIDAGSEREVTMENEQLWLAIREELRGWSPDWEKEPPTESTQAS